MAKANAKPRRPPGSVRPGFAVLHADGGAKDAWVEAAIGYLLDDAEGRRVAEHSAALGPASAAEAEYRALLAGLTRAHELGLGAVVARSDSKLLVGHLNGERHIRNARLVTLEAQIAELRTRIGSVIFEWIPASANGEAHELVARRLSGHDEAQLSN